MTFVYLQVYTGFMREKNSKNELFGAALALFAEKGYDAVSPGEIVEKVGITKPTLYYFFGSKEGLFEDILKTCYTKLDALLAACCHYEPRPENYDEDVYPALVRVVNAYFGFAKENRDFYSMVMSLGFSPPSSKAAKLAEQYQLRQYQILQALFEEFSAVHRNLLGKERALVWRFLALVNAQIGYWRRGYGTLCKDDARSIVGGFMHGIFS